MHMEDRSCNKRIYEVIGSVEGKDEVDVMSILGINISECSEQDISSISTGDILKYIDCDTSKEYYGVFIKKFTPMVLIYNPIRKCMAVEDFSERIGKLELKCAFQTL